MYTNYFKFQLLNIRNFESNQEMHQAVNFYENKTLKNTISRETNVNQSNVSVWKNIIFLMLIIFIYFFFNFERHICIACYSRGYDIAEILLAFNTN